MQTTADYDPQQDLISQMAKNRRLRTKITSQSHFWFFHFYFAHYVKCATPDFHREIYALTEDFSLGHLVIPAFRHSGKSTIFCLSYPLWAVLGKPKYKFILIVGKTQEQARIYMKNLTDELVKNDLLKSDMGPFREDDVWRSNTIVLTKHNAMIMAVSSEQSIRGIRYGNMRPQLVICDDLEDSYSVKTLENRDKLYDWVKNDLMPVRETGARLVVAGSILHLDSLVMRLKKEIEEGKLQGIYKAYPLLGKDGNSLWRGKYPDAEAIDRLKKEIGNEAAWSQEFLLMPSQRENAVIRPEWIHYYEELPDIRNSKNAFRFAVTGIDLAISVKTSADYTAMVSAFVFGWDDKLKIYILPHPINERLDFPQTLIKAKQLSLSLVAGKKSRLVVESVGYQPALVQQLQKEGYPAEEFKVYGQDKEERLRITSPHVKLGTVLFPKKGAEILVQQLVGFGVEKHDDLSDSFAILVNQIMAGKNKKPATPEVFGI